MFILNLISCIFPNFMMFFCRLSKNLPQILIFHHPFLSKNCVKNYFSHIFVVSTMFLNFCNFEDFLCWKIISKAVFPADVWQQQQWKIYCVISTISLVQKTIGKQNILQVFFVSWNVLRQGDFFSSPYSVTFVIFGMSPMYKAPNYGMKYNL